MLFSSSLEISRGFKALVGTGSADGLPPLDLAGSLPSSAELLSRSDSASSSAANLSLFEASNESSNSAIVQFFGGLFSFLRNASDTLYLFGEIVDEVSGTSGIKVFFDEIFGSDLEDLEDLEEGFVRPMVA